MAGCMAVAALAASLWRDRHVSSLAGVALWLEGRFPEFRYALVTAADPRYAAMLEGEASSVLGRVNLRRSVVRAAPAAVLPPVGIIIVSALAIVLLPRAPFALPATSSGESLLAAGAGELASRLSPLEVEITPPAYAIAAGLPGETLEDPTAVVALVGSQAVISGPGGSEGLQVKLGEEVLSVVGSGDRWSARFTIPSSPTLVQMTDRGHSRALLLEPRADAPPRAHLVLPAQDTTLRVVSGALVLEAQLQDDLGLSRGWFEWIVSSGEGEGTYQHREGRLGLRDLARSRTGTLRFSVPLATFQLGPGDMLSVRAVTEDINSSQRTGCRRFGNPTGAACTRGRVRLALRGGRTAGNGLDHDDAAVPDRPQRSAGGGTRWDGARALRGLVDRPWPPSRAPS